MTCGFTGTQRGMRPRQLEAVRQLLCNVTTLHLGDCIGADADAYKEATALGIKTIGHPPSNASKRANCKYDEELPARPYLMRNADIAFAGVDGLIAAPADFTVNVLRSGTWATIRYARSLKRRVWIVKPDGSVAVYV